MKFTSEDLLKAMGLKVGQTLKFNHGIFKLVVGSKKNIIILQSEHKDMGLGILIDQEFEIIQPKLTLTEDEKVILRNVDKRYKYIAKDNYEEKGMENDLVLFAQEPVKNDYWFEVSVENTDCVYFSGYLHLFQFIKPMECYSIEELLKD